MSDSIQIPLTVTSPEDQPIVLTDSAAEKVKELMAREESSDGLALRVAVQPGGCSGLR